MKVEKGKKYKIVDNVDNFHSYEMGTIVELVDSDDEEPRWLMNDNSGAGCMQWVFTADLEDI